MDSLLNTRLDLCRPWDFGGAITPNAFFQVFGPVRGSGDLGAYLEQRKGYERSERYKSLWGLRCC